ncbi:DUF4625 domain-containing protein [Aquimarina sp. U1-2]|uniref:DUF4625 domain-containing protein n=1 Tax=Aquimarina sp. U1-2 TaxID=2823141 RepID=UPI001AECC829|nr:DUF4625 domain-containing protein [Aquimarina sp. U1-2]MBP2832929.1 DUF4625 domain-containing protein [Aquimarina sp. U1-2]
MKLHYLLCASSLLFISCLGDDDANDTDLQAPAIKANDNLSTILPYHFLTTTNEDTEIPLAFTIEDNSGIREIKLESHNGFDGHTHGKSRISKNSQFKLFSFFELIEIENSEQPTTFTRSSESGAAIYLDERNTSLEANDLILAGPYHFSIQATDILGNQTRYQDNTTYHTTIYINRAYAPQVEISNVAISSKEISGEITRNVSHTASSDIRFLWIYIEQPVLDNPGQEGAIVKNWVWGSSNWPHQFRPNSGDALPNTQTIDLSSLLNKNDDFFANLQDNILVIWAEDDNGNITVNKLPIN